VAPRSLLGADRLASNARRCIGAQRVAEICGQADSTAVSRGWGYLRRTPL